MAKKVLSSFLALLMLFSVFSAITVYADDAKILGTLYIVEGETKPLSFTDPNGNPVSVIWESTDPDIATVDDKGNVYAKKAGVCIMSCWWNGKLYGANIVVETSGNSSSTSKKTTTKTTAKKISLSKTSLSVNKGKTATLKLKNATASKVKWTSSNKKIATVSSKGVVKGVKAGKATVTATYKGKKYKCAPLQLKIQQAQSSRRLIRLKTIFSKTVKNGIQE